MGWLGAAAPPEAAAARPLSAGPARPRRRLVLLRGPMACGKSSAFRTLHDASDPHGPAPDAERCRGGGGGAPPPPDADISAGWVFLDHVGLKRGLRHVADAARKPLAKALPRA